MHKLYVGNLPWSMRDDELKAHFEKAGAVVSATVITERETGRSRGFGFVVMDSEEAMRKAIEMFNGSEVEGRKLTVNVAQPKEEGGRRER